MFEILSTECNGNWIVPDGWTGSRPVVYPNLDNSMGLTLESGAQIVPGKVYSSYAKIDEICQKATF